MRGLIFGRHPHRTLVRVVILIGASILVFGYVLVPVRGQGPSMSPAVQDGQLFFVNTFAYALWQPRRGDIVAIRMAGRRVVYVKRVIALPGERARIEAGIVHIEDVPLTEPYVRERRPWTAGEVTLGPDSYLVIGDNRGMAMDAHDFGIVRRQRILGRVLRLR